MGHQYKMLRVILLKPSDARFPSLISGAILLGYEDTLNEIARSFTNSTIKVHSNTNWSLIHDLAKNLDIAVVGSDHSLIKTALEWADEVIR